MDERLTGYFEREVARRSANPIYDRIVREIKGAGSKLGRSVRADAIYFIASNLYDIVWEPVTATMGDGTVEVSREKLEVAISHDAWKIVQRSAEVAVRTHRSEITTNSTILALAEVVEELEINSDSLKLWGRKD